jgi:hypothetical protein
MTLAWIGLVLIALAVAGTYVLQAAIWAVGLVAAVLYWLGAVAVFLAVLVVNPPHGLRLWREAELLRA